MTKYSSLLMGLVIEHETLLGKLLRENQGSQEKAILTAQS